MGWSDVVDDVQLFGLWKLISENRTENPLTHLAVSELARDELERLVKEDDGEGDLQDGNPLLQVERCDLKHGLHAAATQNMRYLRHVTCMFDTGPASVVEIARFSHRKKVDFEDDEVKRQREGHGTEQPVVVPGRHRHQRLVLRNTKQNTLYNYYEQV